MYVLQSKNDGTWIRLVGTHRASPTDRQRFGEPWPGGVTHDCGSINGTFRDAQTLGTVRNCLVYRAAISLITLINQQLCIQYLGIEPYTPQTPTTKILAVGTFAPGTDMSQVQLVQHSKIRGPTSGMGPPHETRRRS